MQFCDQCGAILLDGAVFCASCGAKPSGAAAPSVPEKKARSRRLDLRVFLLGLGASLALLILLALLLPVSLGPGLRKLEGRGFSSAEKAAMAYVDALKKGDLDALLSTFAQESYAEHLDRRAYLTKSLIYLNARSVMFAGYLPDSCDLALSLDAEGRRAYQLRLLYGQYQDLLLGDKLNEMKESTSQYIRTTDDEVRRELIAALNAKTPFSSVEFVRFIPPEYLLESDMLGTYREFLAEYSVIYGVEELQDLVLLVRIDGEEYLLFLCVGKYDGRWYNISIGNIAALIWGRPLNNGLVKADKYGL